VLREVRKGQSLTWRDVSMDTSTQAFRTRKEMETMFAQVSLT
jgi:predicted homoserine dehydrogenase-like protein